MESELLDCIHKFQTKQNKHNKLIKFNDKIHILILILITLLTFFISLLILDNIKFLKENLKLVDRVIISELLCIIFSMTYIFIIYKSNIKKRKSDFNNFINNKIICEEVNYSGLVNKINIKNLEDFQKYNLISFIYNKSSSSINNNKFKELYDLIDIRLERHNFSDYITPKAAIIYGIISTLATSIIIVFLTELLDVFLTTIPDEFKLDKVALLMSLISAVVILGAAIISIIITYKSIFDSEHLSIRKQYLYLKEILKKCEIDFVDSGLTQNDDYMNMVNDVIRYSKKYTYKKK